MAYPAKLPQPEVGDIEAIAKAEQAICTEAGADLYSGVVSRHTRK